MGMIVISLGSAAAAKVAGPAGTPMFAPGSIPEWSQLLLVVIALALIGGVLHQLVALNRNLSETADRHDLFVKGLLKGVRKQTERIERELAAVLHVPPTLPDNGVAYIRDLRRMLRESTAYIAHMRSYPMPAWPGPDLAHAFADWAGVIDAMDSMLDDMFAEVTVAVERGSWVQLFEQYKREEWYFRRDIEKLKGLKTAIEAEARPFEKKDAEARLI
jgi:hypothetical protein